MSRHPENNENAKDVTPGLGGLGVDVTKQRDPGGRPRSSANEDVAGTPSAAEPGPMRIALVSVHSRADQVRRDERRPKAVMKCRLCAISVPTSSSPTVAIPCVVVAASS
jgi:hypothetical protein